MKNKRYLSIMLILLMIFTILPVNYRSNVKAEENTNKYVLNIIWDGLSADYYNTLKEKGLNTPNIDALVQEGTKLDNLKTSIPSYGGAQAAALTGANPESNGFLYRYLDKETSTQKINVYDFNAETIFEAVNKQKPELKTLALGMNVAGKTLEGRGVSEGDANHKYIKYDLGDKLVSFDNVSKDILSAINSAQTPDYIMAYSNDIKMLYWNGGASDQNLVDSSVISKLQSMDAKLGEITEALKSKGIYESTVIVLNSLSSLYTTKSKINAATMATSITSATGVKTEFISANPAADTKATIIKHYIMKYAQLTFTKNATQEDKDKVIAYLNDKTNDAGKLIKDIVSPADVKAPAAFADYILNPIDNYTFSQAGAGSFRTDNLDDMNQFCVISGVGVIKNTKPLQASLVDIVPNLCSILGINPPTNNEGKLWNMFDLEKPTLEVTLEGRKDSEGNYLEEVKVTLKATDNGSYKVQYDTGEGYLDYAQPITINKDCTFKVKVTDGAGNTAYKEENIKFIKLVDSVSLQGNTEVLGDALVTEDSSIKVTGTTQIKDSNLTIKVNGEQVSLDSGAFSKDIQLKDGENIIKIESELNGVGNIIIYKVLKPYEPKVTSVNDGGVVSDSVLKLQGTVCPNSTVTVNGKAALVDEQGNLSADLDLAEGENNIEVSAVLGSSVKKTSIKVSYYTPVKVDITNFTNKQIVKKDSVTIEGTVDKDCSVKVNGAAAELSGNKFSKEVELSKGINTITVQTDYKGVTSSKSVKLNYIEPDENYVVYINWDGFANYYYEAASSLGKTPVLDSLIKEGVYFKDTSSGIPSITNAMQAAIVSGTYSNGTGNGYRYFDKKNNVVIQFTRENNAETIAEAVARQGLKPASVHQFALQDRGTVIGDASRPYIQLPDPSDYAARFDGAIKLIKGEPVGEGIARVELDDIPKFLALYMDDLDALGHNEAVHYGSKLAQTEEERMNGVIERLRLMDSKLGEFIEACKERGIYDNMNFVLTTDHGMAPFGQQGVEADDYGYSKLPDLISTVEALGYKCEVLFGDQSPKADTDIVIVDVGLQAQLSFTKAFTEQEVDNIINAVKDKAYFGRAMKVDEMKQRGVMDGFADLIISPKAPYSFKTGEPKLYKARGQHDSLDEKAQHIFSLMWGKDVKKGYVHEERIYNIDFARTMTKLLGIEAPKNATGAILNAALIENNNQEGEGPTDETPVIPLPQTGYPMDLTVVTALGTILIILGIVLLRRKNKAL
jgi:LPXTG-motif cell wall-anchored protein